jgi:dipeptidyl aminopeptidase/acylaminoacyl peptidase
LPDKKQLEVSKIWDKCDFYEIVYISDGLKVKGYLIEPKKLRKKNPIIIYNRGGSKDVGTINEIILYFRLAEYVSWGYIVIASQYRGSQGSEGKDEFGGNDINDVLNLKNVLSESSYTDMERIGMIGGSRGGMMAYKALTMVDWIKVAIIEAGVTDIEHSYMYRPQLKEFRRDMYDVDSLIENQSRSALHFAEQIVKNVPILIFHGSKDTTVSPLDSLRLCEKIQENGNPYELHIYKDLDHMLKGRDRRIRSKEWLKKYL